MKMKCKRLISIVAMVILVVTLPSCGIKTVENMEFAIETPYIGEQMGSYTGEVKKDIPNGLGKFIVEDLYTYEGEFLEGKFNGTGTMTGGSSVLGFLEEKLEGTFESSEYFSGIMSLGGIKLYEGEMRWGKHSVHYLHSGLDIGDYAFDGKGILYDAEGNITYEGEFQKNMPVNKKAFKAACKEYSMEELYKYQNSKKYTLVKYTDTDCSTSTVSGFMNNWTNFYDYDGGWFSDYSVSLSYRYGDKEERLVDGESFTAYGILTSNEYDGSPDIWILLLERN